MQTDSLETLFCDHVDGATHTCEAAKTEKMDYLNSSNDSLDWHLFYNKLPLYHPIDLSSLSSTKLKKIQQKYSAMYSNENTSNNSAGTSTSTAKLRKCLSSKWRDKLFSRSIKMEMKFINYKSSRVQTQMPQIPPTTNHRSVQSPKPWCVTYKNSQLNLEGRQDRGSLCFDCSRVVGSRDANF